MPCPAYDSQTLQSVGSRRENCTQAVWLWNSASQIICDDMKLSLILNWMLTKGKKKTCTLRLNENGYFHFRDRIIAPTIECDILPIS